MGFVAIIIFRVATYVCCIDLEGRATRLWRGWPVSAIELSLISITVYNLVV